jgi:hypothetical protein
MDYACYELRMGSKLHLYCLARGTIAECNRAERKAFGGGYVIRDTEKSLARLKAKLGVSPTRPGGAIQYRALPQGTKDELRDD